MLVDLSFNGGGSPTIIFSSSTQAVDSSYSVVSGFSVCLGPCEFTSGGFGARRTCFARHLCMLACRALFSVHFDKFLM